MSIFIGKKFVRLRIIAYFCGQEVKSVALMLQKTSKCYVDT